MRKFFKNFSRAEIRKIAISYSQNPVISKWAKTYEISENMLKKLLYKAITDCIIEDDVAKIILESLKERAISCLEESNNNSLHSFTEKCNKVITERETFKLSDEEAILLTISYACSSLYEDQFCKENAITHSLLYKTLIHVMCNCMVGDEIVGTLEEKVLSFDSYNEVIVDEFFEKIAKARRRFKQVHS